MATSVDSSGTSPCPLLGFNVGGYSMLWAAMLHLLLLALFITLFFYTLGDKAIVGAERELAQAVGQMGAASFSNNATMEDCTSITPSERSAMLSELENRMKPLMSLEEKARDEHNTRLLAINIAILGVALVLCIWFGVKAKKTENVPWPKLACYVICVFILFCGLEAWLFFSIIKKYMPADTVTIGDHFLKTMETELEKNALETSSLTNSETLLLYSMLGQNIVKGAGNLAGQMAKFRSPQ